MSYLFPDSALIIFCKAPVAGQVKTRLQTDLKAEQAAEAHRQLTLMTLERAFRRPLCPVLLCCAPDSDHPFFQQCVNKYPLTLTIQHGAELGQRMHNAFAETLSLYRQAVLIGCDCPSLTVQDLQQAFEALENNNDAVIAPAEDGGYVLIGMNAPQAILFENMRWGHSKVAEETRHRAVQANLRLHELDRQWDVDTFKDWQRYLKCNHSNLS